MAIAPQSLLDVVVSTHPPALATVKYNLVSQTDDDQYMNISYVDIMCVCVMELNITYINLKNICIYNSTYLYIKYINTHTYIYININTICI